MDQVDACEILVIDDIRLPHHAQVFDGQRRDLSLADLIHAGAFRKDGDPQIFPDQVLDRSNVIDFDRYVKVVNGFVYAGQRSLKELSGLGFRKPQNDFFRSESDTAAFFDNGLLFERMQTISSVSSI